MKRLFAIALTVAFTFYLAGCGGAGAASPKDAVASMLEAMKNGDIDKMKTLTPKVALEAGGQREPTEEDRNQMKEEFKEVTWEIGEETIAEDGITADVQVKMNYAGTEIDVTYKCVKEDGAWKVTFDMGGPPE